MQKRYSLLAVIGLVTSALGQPQGVPISPPSPVPPVQLPDDLLVVSQARGACTASHVMVTYDFEPGGSNLKVRWLEIDDVGNRYDNTRIESVPFMITDVASNLGGRRLYVAGVNDRGKTVIQQFVYSRRQGGYSVETTSAWLPLGYVSPPHEAEEQLEGTVFVAPTGPQSYGDPVRTQILASSQVDIIRRIAADPEGRYLLFLTHPIGNLYQLDLLSSQLTLLHTKSTIPALEHSRTIDIRQHTTEGRQVVITQMPSAGVVPSDCKLVSLKDSNNDGGFESHQVRTMLQWETDGLEEQSVWEEEFFMLLGSPF